MKCSRCGFTFDTTQNFCSLCGRVSERVLPQKIPQSVSWESGTAKDYPLIAFLDTIQESFFKADNFFSKIQNSPNKPALLYGMLCGSIGVVATFLWSFFLPDSYKQLSALISQKSDFYTVCINSSDIVHYCLCSFNAGDIPIQKSSNRCHIQNLLLLPGRIDFKRHTHNGANAVYHLMVLSDYHRNSPYTSY